MTVLSQLEVEALLNSPDAATNRAAVDRGPRIEPYSLSRSGHTTPGELRTLTSAFDRFARDYSVALSTCLRTVTEVTLLQLQSMSYGEFLQTLPDPTCFHCLKTDPLDGLAALELNPSFVFAAVDRLLGGDGASQTPSRSLTAIELNVVESVIGSALGCLESLWQPAVPDLHFRVSARETSPYLAQHMPARVGIMRAGFEVRFAGVRGSLALAATHELLEPLAAPFAYGRRRRNEESRAPENNATRLSRLRTPLSAHLKTIPLALNELIALEPGDVLKTDIDINSGLCVRLDGRPKLRAQLLEANNRRALRISGWTAEEQQHDSET